MFHSFRELDKSKSSFCFTTHSIFNSMNNLNVEQKAEQFDLLSRYHQKEVKQLSFKINTVANISSSNYLQFLITNSLKHDIY